MLLLADGNPTKAPSPPALPLDDLPFVVSEKALVDRLRRERVTPLRLGELVALGLGQIDRQVVVEGAAAMERQELHPVADSQDR